MMRLFKIKCQQCGNEIKKIKKIQDIFLIKSGRKIVCEKCNSEYSVSKIVAYIGKMYNYLFIGGLSIFIWLALTILIDKILGEEWANFLGIWVWSISAVTYIVIEFTIAMILPLKIEYFDKARKI